MLLAGVWNASITVGGVARTVTSAWEPICWVTDNDVVYLELEASLGGDLRLQRHVLLGRKDRFVLLADSVLGRQRRGHRISAQIACGRCVTSQAAPTRELLLATPERRHLVLPLALSEWRSEPAQGDLRFQAPCLEWSVATKGSSLFAPVLIDLDPWRRRKHFTWRQLTVAEDRQIQPPDVAVGYRVQVRDKHWLFYRALAGKSGRTVIGVNLWSEMLVSRLDESGTWERLLEIE